MTNSSVGHLGILEFHKLRNRASSLIGQLQAVTKAFGLHSGPGKGKEPGNEIALLYCTYLPGGGGVLRGKKDRNDRRKS